MAYFVWENCKSDGPLFLCSTITILFIQVLFYEPMNDDSIIDMERKNKTTFKDQQNWTFKPIAII